MAITDIGSSISIFPQETISRLFKRGATLPVRAPATPFSWRTKAFATASPSNKLFIAPAAHERARIVYISGLNSSPTFFKDEIVPLQKTGISMYGYSLPSTDHAQNNLIDYLKEPVEDLLFNPNSPIYENLKDDVPIYIITHSTGGLIVNGFSLDLEKRTFLEESKISGAIHLAPFFDTANASKLFNPIADPSYSAYAHLFGLVKSGSLPIDKLYFYAHRESQKQEAEDTSSYQDPRHWQIRELRSYGREIVSRMLELQQDIDYLPIALPQTFITGEHDPFACSQTAALVSSLQCGELLELNCKHNPIKQQFIEAIERIHSNISRCADNLGDIKSAVERHYRGDALIPTSI